jgi:polar amino acid transport system substrate-binding protein
MIRNGCLLAFAALLAACTAIGPSAPADIAPVLAPNGVLRVGVYPGSPTSLVRDAKTGEAKGVSVDVGRELARRLGARYEQVEFQRVAEVIDGIKAGKADFTITNASPARARDVDFSQPVLAIELGYLAPPGSSVTSVADVDRPGVRIGVTEGSTSQRTLNERLKNATLVAAPNMKAAAEMLKGRQLDAFATNKAILFELSDNVPGSHVLDGRWGVEHLAVAIPKGRERGATYIKSFVEDVTRSGVVARAAERAGLRGLAKE